MAWAPAAAIWVVNHSRSLFYPRVWACVHSVWNQRVVCEMAGSPHPREDRQWDWAVVFLLHPQMHWQLQTRRRLRLRHLRYFPRHCVSST